MQRLALPCASRHRDISASVTHQKSCPAGSRTHRLPVLSPIRPPLDLFRNDAPKITTDRRRSNTSLTQPQAHDVDCALPWARDAPPSHTGTGTGTGTDTGTGTGHSASPCGACRAETQAPPERAPTGSSLQGPNHRDLGIRTLIRVSTCIESRPLPTDTCRGRRHGSGPVFPALAPELPLADLKDITPSTPMMVSPLFWVMEPQLTVPKTSF
ncbi:hypothetical protein CSHISOI_05084 [Colletotrichum shisoi]|uniref:Uncharacterized protein n=1 Tax=Colletotrichum shisoi TaxID=2078593 RepID=A0A5Q4BUX2_9PEZI|nr:hypothetical protein CSHISOI_05084 [Colletotrichum shisoi]